MCEELASIRMDTTRHSRCELTNHVMWLACAPTSLRFCLAILFSVALRHVLGDPRQAVPEVALVGEGKPAPLHVQKEVSLL